MYIPADSRFRGRIYGCELATAAKGMVEIGGEPGAVLDGAGKLE